MSDWRASAGPEVARRRTELLANVRDYFDARKVLAVDTPALSPYSVTDPNIDSIPANGLFLHTSPEFRMKRLLADGYPDIYSICRVFREGESGRRHLPEFTMIEWYRKEFSLEEIITDTTSLIAAVLERPALVNEISRTSYAGVFSKILKVDPLTAKVGTLADSANADDRIRRSLAGNRDAWLDLLFSTRIAPAFPRDRLTVVTHYPASQAALARLSPDDPAVAERFEVFLGDLELANGYVELTDAHEQERRMHSDLAIRKAAGKPVAPIDQSLVAALEAGLPECAGVAVGFERLHMIDAGADHIRNVVSFAE